MSRPLIRVLTAILCLVLGALPAPLVAQGASLTLGVSEDLAASGMARHLAPRFGMRANARVTVMPADAGGLAALLREGALDVVIAPEAVVAVLEAEGLLARGVPAFSSEGEAPLGYVVAGLPGAAADSRATAFRDWLTGQVGRNTVEAFSGPVAYAPGTVMIERPAAVVPDGDAVAGADLALAHCGRCHRIDERNRFGGLSNTPSFAALRAQEVWLEKFTGFWLLNPHPSFTQIAGLTRPLDPERPPSLYPLHLTPEEVDAIIAFAATIEPLDLGAPLTMR